MLVNFTANVEQIRWHAQSALNGFETLDLETAAYEAQSELRALLRYLDGLDSANSAPPIFLSVGVKSVVIIEGVGGNVE